MSENFPSGSQEGQDAWLLNEVFPGGRPGYFVDVGAADGRYLSNTWRLEQAGWQGLCIEPSSMYFELVKRRNCRCDHSLVAPRRDWFPFLESQSSAAFGPDPHHHLSGITDWLDCYQPVGTTATRLGKPLADILEHWECPAFIHYLSIDVEGAELAILEGFPFDRWRFGAITCEHNNQEPKRTGIRQRLSSAGYVLARSSQFDDWFLGCE